MAREGESIVVTIIQQEISLNLNRLKLLFQRHKDIQNIIILKRKKRKKKETKRKKIK